MDGVDRVTGIEQERERFGAIDGDRQQDQAIPFALQQRLVADADSFNPQNKTTVHSLNTSHSPFLSAPHDLASVLDQIARS